MIRIAGAASSPGLPMRRTLLLTALLGAFALPPATAWSSGVDVIRDCTDNGRIDDDHGPKDYSDALANLPTDVDEYTDCRQVISTAQRTPPASSSDGGGDGGGGGGGRGKGSGSSARTASKSNSPAKSVAQGRPVVPPGSRLADKPLRHGVPLSVIIVLAVLALGVVAWLMSGWGGRPRMSLGRVVHRVFPRRT